MGYEPVRGALEFEYSAITRAVAGLEPPAFGRRTRCAGWDLRALLQHLAEGARKAVSDLGTTAAGAPEIDYVTYWRTSGNDGGGGFHSAAFAAGRPPARELLNEWAACADAAVAAVRAAPPERVVVTDGRRVRARDLVRTLVVEATVHGIDIAPAVGREPWASEVGVQVAVETLAGLLGADPPSELAWDARSFVLKGTGRVSLTEAERAILERAGAKWPLLV